MKKFSTFAVNLIVLFTICSAFIFKVGWHEHENFSNLHETNEFDYEMFISEGKFSEAKKCALENIKDKDFKYRIDAAEDFTCGTFGKPDFKMALDFYFTEEKLNGLNAYHYFDIALIYGQGGNGIKKDEAKFEEYFARAMKLVRNVEKSPEEDDKWINVDYFYYKITEFNSFEDSPFESGSTIDVSPQKKLALKMLSYAIENDFICQNYDMYENLLLENSLMDKAIEVLKRHVFDAKKPAYYSERWLYIKLLFANKKYLPLDYNDAFKALNIAYSYDKESLYRAELLLLASLYKNGLGVVKCRQKYEEILKYLVKTSKPKFSKSHDLRELLQAVFNFYSGKRTSIEDKELTLDVANIVEEIIANEKLKDIEYIFKDLLDFYKTDVKNKAKVEALYKKFAPKSKMIELGYAKYQEAKNSKN